jgi:hypothetical protein
MAHFSAKISKHTKGKFLFPPTPRDVGEFGQYCLIPGTESDHPNAIQVVCSLLNHSEEMESGLRLDDKRG